ILIDTPPKIDSDLKPALKVADLVVVPVSASEVDLWATEGVLDLAVREGKRPLVVLNRARPGTKLSQRILASFDGLEADPAQTVLGQRVAYAESLGAGQGACEFRGGTKAAEEVSALTDEVLKRLKS
ncbi:MAG: ParA family protein, partial [Pseudomonadota bacterium]